MIQTLVLGNFCSSPTRTNFNENLVSEFVSSVCFVEIRAFGLQRTSPDVVFWLKLVSVLGFESSYIVEKQLHRGM